MAVIGPIRVGSGMPSPGEHNPEIRSVAELESLQSVVDTVYTVYGTQGNSGRLRVNTRGN